MKINAKKIFPLIITTLFLLFVVPGVVEANGNVYGNAWSEGVGWISFNSCSTPNSCTSTGAPSHAVTLDINSNKVSGTAWNKNIGLISFNPDDWGECPPGVSSCNNFQNKWKKDGWARAVSTASATSGGWDGWISLGNTGVYDADIDKNTAVQMNSSDFSGSDTYIVDSGSNGYWWGDEVIGWIDLNPSGGAPYVTTNGGVFVAALGNDLTLTAPAYVTAGDDATFTWEAQNGFTPTSCERTSNPPGSTWDQPSYSVSVTSDSIPDIEIPHNNNASSTQTEFTLSCTDGAVTHNAVWSVIATQFHPEISFPYSCIVKTNNPTLEIQNIEDAGSPSCNVYASDSSDPNRTVGTTSSSSIEDTGFNDLDTDYTLECINGSTNIAYYQTPTPTEVKVCSPFFHVIGDTRCSTNFTNEKYGDVLAVSGTNYVADIILTLNPFFGFDTTPVTISSPDSNLSFSTNNFVWNGSEYNTITGTYTITDANYITATNDGEDPIVAPLSFSTDPKTSVSLNFCPTGSGFVKYNPVYKPF